jgi:hypothetical protein
MCEILFFRKKDSTRMHEEGQVNEEKAPGKMIVGKMIGEAGSGLHYFAPIILPDLFALFFSDSHSLATHSLARFFPPYGGLRLRRDGESVESVIRSFLPLLSRFFACFAATPPGFRS